MKNYFRSINSKAQLIYLGLVISVAPVTSTFAMLPMMSEVFDSSSITIVSTNQQQDDNYSSSDSINLMASSHQKISTDHNASFLGADAEQTPIIYLSEHTIVMRSPS